MLKLNLQSKTVKEEIPKKTVDNGRVDFYHTMRGFDFVSKGGLDSDIIYMKMKKSDNIFLVLFNSYVSIRLFTMDNYYEINRLKYPSNVKELTFKELIELFLNNE